MKNRENKYLEYKENIESSTYLKTISAFANYNDGKIIFGVADNGTIKGVENPKQACLNIENRINDNIKPIPPYTLDINNDNTIVLQVFQGSYKPYLYKGKAYKRNDSASIEVDRLELNRLILEGMNLTYEEIESSDQDLSFNTLEKELANTLNIKKVDKDILRTLGLITDGKYNNTAALIADENKFPGIEIIRFGETINVIKDRVSIDNVSIFNLYHKSEAVFEQYYTYEKIEGSLRNKKELIPELAFREAIANALIHRLWDTNIKIRISMYDDKIEISSPGSLPEDVSEEEYLNGQLSALRNPIIATIFFRLHYIEALGTGIKRINEAYSISNTKPIYKVYENSISVTLPIINNDIILSEDEITILQYLKTNQLMSRNDIEKYTSFNKSKTIRLLNSLLDKNMIIKSGETRNIKYLLKKIN